MSVQALSISCSYCLTDGSGTDLPFCVCQCPINSIWEPSNSKQILLHIVYIKSSETEQDIPLKCHMQALHLVSFLNGCPYFQVHLGFMKRAILTNSTNSSYLGIEYMVLKPEPLPVGHEFVWHIHPMWGIFLHILLLTKVVCTKPTCLGIFFWRHEILQPIVPHRCHTACAGS